MANFNLNKTQSLNGALWAVYMVEDRGNFVALGGGVRNQPYLFSPHIRTLKIAYTYVYRNYMGLAQ